MPNYVVSFAGTWPAGGFDRTGAVVFRVAAEDDTEVFRFAVAMTGTVQVGFRGLSPDEIAGLLLEAGVDDLDEGLRLGTLPPADGAATVEQVYSSEDYDRLNSYRDRVKECVWQKRAARGWICHAAAPGDDGRTTAALCASCVIPDARILCSELMHVSITGQRDPEEGYQRVTAQRPLCNAGNEPGDGGKCHAGGRECWRRSISTDRTAVDPPPDVAERAADEIDFFGLVYRDRYAVRGVWPVPQARSIAALFGTCADADDFQHRMAALADLLGKIDPYAQLPEERRVDSSGNRVGSLVALERLMERDHPEAVPAVRMLRRVLDARNAFPIHTRSEKLLDALRALGVSFPATDWNVAWLRVLGSFWASVRDIRIALQAESVVDDLDAADATG